MVYSERCLMYSRLVVERVIPLVFLVGCGPRVSPRPRLASRPAVTTRPATPSCSFAMEDGATTRIRVIVPSSERQHLVVAGDLVTCDLEITEEAAGGRVQTVRCVSSGSTEMQTTVYPGRTDVTVRDGAGATLDCALDDRWLPD
jgi:hypothetical protein